MKFFLEIRKVYKYAILLNIILITFIIYQLFYSKYYWTGPEEKKFVIEPGKNLDQIIFDLKRENIIQNSFLFKLAVKFAGKENQIISKGYLFKNGISNLQLIEQLTDKNLVQLIKLTIPEGYTIHQIGRLVEKKLFLSKQNFINETHSDSLIELIGLKGQIKNLEGFLYPDTYDIAPAINEKALVSMLFNEFRKKILGDSELQDQINSQQTDLLKVVTLASIIEGETQLQHEKPLIAGVYLNRLKKGMRLEADPTIQYILPDGPRRLLYEDLKISSPYNTYLNRGLPPGPINNPDKSSIQAALNADKHSYLFFVATGEGGHKFSENYEEHLKAVKEYRLRLKKNNK